MIVGLSPHSGIKGSFRALTDYFDSSHVDKPHPMGGRSVEIRNPAPEVLAGDAPLFRSFLQALPFRHRYVAATLSFDRADIDVEAFNAGDATSRWAVDRTLGLWFELGFAGIPLTARPPCYVTTHTHTGRLEVNVAMPRGVLRPDGCVRSLNPAPPGPRNQAGRDAFRALVNQVFDWADPSEPARARAIVRPDYQQKQQAAWTRMGYAVPASAIDRIINMLLADHAAQRVQGRANLLQRLEQLAHQEGLVLFTIGDGFVTLGPPDAPKSRQTRLRGRLFAQKGPDPEPGQRLDPDHPARALQTYLDQRRAFHQSRLGRQVWTENSFCVQNWIATAQKAPLTPDLRWCAPHHPNTAGLSPIQRLRQQLLCPPARLNLHDTLPRPEPREPVVSISSP
jgi:hypothetical protein